MYKSTISNFLRKPSIHYCLQLIFFILIALLVSFYFQENRLYQKFKIKVDNQALDIFHSSVDGNLEIEFSEYFYRLVEPLPQQKYNYGRADYIRILKDYFLFLKDDLIYENSTNLSKISKEIYSQSEFNFIQLVLSSYKQDFINVTSFNNSFVKKDFQNFIDETSKLYKLDVLERQSAITDNKNKDILKSIKKYDIDAYKDYTSKYPNYFDKSDTDFDKIKDLLAIDKYKSEVQIYENIIKSNYFKEYYEQYFQNISLFKIEDMAIAQLGPNKKIVTLAIFVLILLIIYLEVSKWKKKKSSHT